MWSKWKNPPREADPVAMILAWVISSMFCFVVVHRLSEYKEQIGIASIFIMILLFPISGIIGWAIAPSQEGEGLIMVIGGPLGLWAVFVAVMICGSFT